MKTIVLVLSLLVVGLGMAAEDAKVFTAEERSWWAIQPVRDPAVLPQGEGWARNDVDHFVAGVLQREGLKPAPEADRHELVRRAYFDLHGLPPTPEEVATFVNDESPKAWERLVDELLESPRYGERWAQHWLDVVRFAESDGYRQDAFRANAWPYRDYVIRSFNEDKPYDQFVREQLAGDEIDPGNPEVVIGTAFLRNGLYEYNQRDVRFHWELIVNELTNVTSEAFLGLGMGCAQCHDHKFDPILQKDYYRLQAFLAPVRWQHDVALATPEEQERYDAELAKWESATTEIRKEIDAILEPKIKKVTDDSFIKFPEDIQALFHKEEAERTPYEQQLMELAKIQLDYERERFDEKKIKGEEKTRLDALRSELAKFDDLKPKPLPTAFVATDVRHDAPRVPLGGRTGKGNVKPGILSIMDPGDFLIPSGDRAPTTGRRLALANWITRRDNPLAARVMVNRLWQQHFGQGLVATPNDFGALGELPSHPDLLDWLATRFMEGGWRMKSIHRQIMNSATYRQTARIEPGEVAKRKDPQNRFLWRFSPRRLDAEQVRDAMLAASGELNVTAVGGPSVSGDTPRRSIYVKKIRNTPDEMLKGFDAPQGFESAATRDATTTAVQSLQLVNGDWTTRRARALAKRLAGARKTIGADDLRAAFRITLGREATSEEVEAGLAFIESQRSRVAAAATIAPKYPSYRAFPKKIGRESGLVLGERIRNFQPGGRFERLHLRDLALESDEFGIEAVAILDGLYPNADVRTLAARWNGDKARGGWTFGVTSEKSRYEPRNFIMQLVGQDFQGNTVYEVVHSDLRVPLGVPVYLAAVVSTEPPPQNQTGGTVTFYMKDLSDPKAKLEVRTVPHPIVQGLQDPGVRTILGGRDEESHSMWDGPVARLAITNGPLAADQLLIAARAAERERLLDLRLDGRPDDSTIPGAEWLRTKPKEPAGPPPDLMGAFTDFCHALLNSNEFLYLH